MYVNGTPDTKFLEVFHLFSTLLVASPFQRISQHGTEHTNQLLKLSSALFSPELRPLTVPSGVDDLLQRRISACLCDR